MSAFLTYAAVSTLAGGISKVMGNKKQPPRQVEDLNEKVMEPESSILDSPQEEVLLRPEEENVNKVRQGFEHLIASKKASLSTTDEISIPAIQSDISVMESLQEGFENIQSSQSDTQRIIKETSGKQMKGLSDLWKGIKALSAGVVGYGTAQAQKTIEGNTGGLGGILGSVAVFASELWKYLSDFFSNIGRDSMIDSMLESGVNPYEKLKYYQSEEAKKIMDKENLTPDDIYEANKEEYKFRNKMRDVYKGLEVLDLKPNPSEGKFPLSDVVDSYDRKTVVKEFIEKHPQFFQHYSTNNFKELRTLFNEEKYDQIVAKIPGVNEIKEIKISEMGFSIPEKHLEKNVVAETVREDILEEKVDPVGNVIFEAEEDVLDISNKFLNSMNLNPISEKEMFDNKKMLSKADKSLAELILKRLKEVGNPAANEFSVKEVRDMISSDDFSSILNYQSPQEIEPVGKSSNLPPVINQDNSQHSTNPTFNLYGVKQTYGQPILSPEDNTILSG